METDLTKEISDVLEICGLPFNKCVLDEHVKSRLLQSTSKDEAFQEVLDFVKMLSHFELYSFTTINIENEIRYVLRCKE